MSTLLKALFSQEPVNTFQSVNWLFLIEKKLECCPLSLLIKLKHDNIPGEQEKVEINSTACNSKLNGAPMTRVELQAKPVEKSISRVMPILLTSFYLC